MKMPVTYVHLQRHDVFPVNLDLDQRVTSVDNRPLKPLPSRSHGDTAYRTIPLTGPDGGLSEIWIAAFASEVVDC